MIKATFLSAATLGLILTAVTASASSELYIGGVSGTVLKEPSVGAILGYGFESRGKDFILGLEFELEYDSVKYPATPSATEDTHAYGVGMHVKAGYNIFSSLNAYALGGLKTQMFGNSSSSNSAENSNAGHGFGYGAGLEYSMSKSFAVAAEYRTYSMSALHLDYDVNMMDVLLKYKF